MDVNAVQAICNTIADYRQGDHIPARTPRDVVRWAQQIDPAFRDGLIDELAHVLDSTYLSKQAVHNFLKKLIHNPKLNGGDASKFWGNVGLLKIQLRGNSQAEMLGELQTLLQQEIGHQGRIEPTRAESFVYIDDVIFTGNHVLRDLEAWISTSAPNHAEVHVIVAALHEGSWWIKSKITQAAEAAQKTIKINWWRCLTIEDRKTYINESDVLRPRNVGFCTDVQTYANQLGKTVALRTTDSRGRNQIFSGERGRNALELGLLEAGCRVRQQCTFLAEQMRPLGYHYFETLGFGATLITYRNCPNNCPLALWAGDPWFPLFPRKTN